MVTFFGIFDREFGPRVASDEAPHKTGFFGGTPFFGGACDAAPSRAEQDADFLTGKSPAPFDDEGIEADRRFVRLCLPPQF